MDELIKEMIATMLTEEKIVDVVREVVEEQMSYSVRNLIEQSVHDVLRERTDAYIKECVDEQFMKPVKSDDGWGGVEYYDTFEQFVRDYVRNNLSKNWEDADIIEL